MLEENFLEWTQDMTKGSNFASQKVTLTEAHLSPLLKVKRFPPILRQLMRRVRPPNERQHIRLNLKHSSLRKHLTEVKTTTEVQRTHTSLASSVLDAKREISLEAEELKHLVEEEEKLIREERELSRQITLLSIAVEDKVNKVKSLKQWTNTVDHLLPDVAPPSSPQEESIKQEAANEDLKVILSKLKTLKQQFLHSEGKELHDDKLEVWQLVESLVESHTPSALMNALSSITVKETSDLTCSTQQIDLISDAKALRLKCSSSGEFVDELSPQGVLETIESMLVQMSGKHIKNHFKNHKKRQESQTTAESLKNIINSIHSIAKELYSDPSVVSEIMVLCDETLKLAGLKATLATASNLIHDFEVRANVANKAKKVMTEKYNRIHHFDNLVKSRVSEVKSLALGASRSWDHLAEERTDIATIVEEGVNSLSLPTPFLKGSFSKEVEAMLEVPFESLKSSQTEHGTVPSLPLGPIESTNPNLEGLLCAVPYLTSWDNLVEVIRQRKQHLRQHEDLLLGENASFEIMTSDLKNQALSMHEVEELNKKAKSHDLSLEAKILPLLDECEERHQEMERKLDQLRNSIEEWWSQPGPFIKEYITRKHC